jgi:hypothetical protein
MDVIQDPRAAELARKTEMEAQRAARAASEKAERAEHRKWLKETKPERDAWRNFEKRRDAVRARIFGAMWQGATEAVGERIADTLAWEAARREAYLDLMAEVAIATEAAAAKVAGFETWAAFQAAKEAQDAADDAAWEAASGA